MPSQIKKSLSKQQVVSAQVVLRPGSGKSIRGNVAITSENLKDYLPSLRIAAMVEQAFDAYGFAVGSLVGNSFSITAPVDVFERVFKTRLHLDERGAILATGPNKTASLEIPLSALPKGISDNI